MAVCLAHEIFGRAQAIAWIGKQWFLAWARVTCQVCWDRGRGQARLCHSVGHPKTGCMTNTLELLQRHRKTIYLKKFSFPNSIWHRGLSPVWLLVPALAFGGSGRFQDGSIKLECFHDLSRVPFAFALGDIPGISPIRSKHVQNIFRNFGQFQPILNHLGDPDGEVRVLASVLGAVMLPSWRQENYRHIQACGIRMVSSGISPKFWLMLVDVGWYWYSTMFVSYDYGQLWLYNILGGWLSQTQSWGKSIMMVLVRPTWMTNVWAG